MSVEKVNKYKEEKANRKEILAKQKKKAKQTKAIAIACVAAVALLIVGAIGLTIRNEYNAYLNAQPDYSATEMLLGDMAGVLIDETEAETQVQETEAETPAQETEEETEAEG